ncbi:MAG: alanine racemase [Bifidobacteriaceae bacterium]|nr:alanine racemase [Bifidobacteriaceae bacterium]
MSQSRLVIDLDAIRANAARLLEAAGGAELMAVVKANGYGHGAAPVARAAIESGASYLGVAQLDEALDLATALGTDRRGARILAWIYGPDADFGGGIVEEIEFGVSSVEALEAIARAARALGRPAVVHLKMDTGLGRAGAPRDHWEELVRRALRLAAEGAVVASGAWSHFAYADDPGNPTIAAQSQAFADGLEAAKRLGARFEVRHLANSAALATGLPVTYDLVRPGLALYGLSPVPALAGPAELGLTPAMTFESFLSLVKTVAAGQGLSYGHAYVTPTRTVTGLVPAGYADGIPRAATNRGPVRVGGRNLTIAGRVCMDQFVLDLGPDAADQAGDRVVLFGPGAQGEPTAQDWADAVGTISYEITTRLPAHLPRIYLGASRQTVRDLPGSSPELRERSARLVLHSSENPVAPGECEAGGSGPVVVELPTAGDTRAFGRRLAGVVRAGDLVILSGELGAGKTTLTQGLGEGLNVRGRVSSPTFVIARFHPPLGEGPGLLHVDAYRLDSLDELDDLDLDAELADAVTVVEWGSGLAERLADERLEIRLERPHGDPNAGGEEAGNVRLAWLNGIGQRWQPSNLADLLP